MSPTADQTVYRILDASANRAAEGLRTMEEFARFALDDRELAGELKRQRHQLASALERLPRRRLLAARDTAGDVGTTIGVPSEYARAAPAAVVAAAASRTQQAMRCLEEVSKTIEPAVAALVEQIRYRCYTAAAELEMKLGDSRRVERLATAQLYVLIDAGRSQQTFLQTIRTLAAGGVDVVQLRDRTLDDRTLLHRATAGAALAREWNVLFIVNDRADLAVAAGADGVHVGQEELPAAAARAILGPERLVGVSTHSLEQAAEAAAEGADYIGCGPVFPGQTKAFDTYVGTELLQQVASQTPLPAFAIGGITAGNLDEVITAGFTRIAVTGAVRDAADPERAAAELKQRLCAARDSSCPDS